LVCLGEVGNLLHMMVPDHTGDTREFLVVRRDDTKGLVILEQAATNLFAQGTASNRWSRGLFRTGMA
jgi:hypothetical protein